REAHQIGVDRGDRALDLYVCARKRDRSTWGDVPRTTMTPMCSGSCSIVVGEPLTVSSRPAAASEEVRGDSPADACCCPFVPIPPQPIATTGSTTTQIGGSALGRARAPAANNVAPAISAKTNATRRATPLMSDVVGRRPRQGREVSLRRGAAAGDLYGYTG